MITRESHHLQAELIALERLISQIPESNVIDRMSLEARKNEVAEVLSSQIIPYYEPVRVRLTFRGKPIIKSYGIFAEFAAVILDKFENMVAAIGSSQTIQLGARGIIPNRDDYRLIITGTTPGSFGFELEEAPRDRPILLPELSPVKEAIDKAKLIMESSLKSDEDLADAIADADPRAIKEMREFLGMMADNEAVCALELEGLEGKSFRFDDVEQVKRTKERFSQDNIREGDREILGMFQGVLPTRRTFEFLIKEPEEVILGKVGPEIEDASKINHIIEKPAKIQVHTKQVGSSRPRYVLNKIEEIKE